MIAPGEKMGGETHGVGWGQRNYHPGKRVEDFDLLKSVIGM